MNDIEKQKVLSFLEKAEINYELLEHEELATMEACESIHNKIGAKHCKNLFLQNRQGTDFYLLLIDDKKKFRTSEVSKKIGTSRLSFGSIDKLQDFLHEYGGAINPFGLIYDTTNKVQLIIDKDLLAWGDICFHPMVNTATVKISVSDLMSKVIPETNHTPIIIEIDSNNI